MLKKRTSFPWPTFWDTLALLLWGLMLLRYWWSGRLSVLLHPDYHWLAIGAGWVLVLMAFWRAWALLTPSKTTDSSHIALFPRQWSLAVLLAIAVFGLTYVPRPFASEAALARGITDPAGLTRSQPQRFARNTPPEERSVIDWIRTLNVYPEPDAYAGEPVNVTGFVIHPPEWPSNYLLVARFVLTCCAADAYPVGLPVKLAGDRADFPQDSWIAVQGEMISESLDGQRRVVIQPQEVIDVPEPKNPYEF